MEELDRANGIINDFLSLAQNRISEKEQWHLHQIINDLSPLLWADANLRGQTIELLLDERVPKLHLNAKEIKQVLLNLARNGMEAMEEKGKLTIQTRFRESDNMVELIVRDLRRRHVQKPAGAALRAVFYDEGQRHGAWSCPLLEHRGAPRGQNRRGIGRGERDGVHHFPAASRILTAEESGASVAGLYLDFKPWEGIIVLNAV